MLKLLQGVRHFLQGDSHIAEQLQFSAIFNLTFKIILILIFFFKVHFAILGKITFLNTLKITPWKKMILVLNIA